MMCAAMAGSALAGCSSGDSQTTAAAAESTSGVTNAAAGVIQLFGGLLG